MGEGPATVRVRHKKTRYYAAIERRRRAGRRRGRGYHGGGRERGAEHRRRGGRPRRRARRAAGRSRRRTATPIKHLVVIFDENVSFDHYFGTYPFAANTDGPPSTPSAAPRR